MADDLYKAYDQKQAVFTPFATANFQSQYGGNVNAVGRSPDSPSGTDWNRTFTQNNPYSPSGTDWSKTFGRTSGALVNLAGNTTPPPSPGDIDNTFFGGPTPTPTPTPKPSLAFYRNRLLDGDLSSRDREMYGAGSDFGFST